ncbi:MAG: AraC family transcriptional regulator [Lentisphaerae bacterium]|nr:AraC family transcriptional regulator [Lentisphaerota bacterium]
MGTADRDGAVLHVGRIDPDPAWGMPAQRHFNHELIAVVGGRMRVTSAGRTLEAGPGDILMYPSRVEHAERTDASDPAETLFIGFYSRRVTTREVVRVEDRRGRIRQAMRWLFEDRLGLDADAAAVRTGLLQVILDEWDRLQRSGPESELVARTHQWVREHVAEPITLGVLAQRAKLSKFHFLRTYRAAAGQTPMQDVRRLRLAYARDQVLGSGMPLKEIARRSGLGSAQAMSRAFLREFGMPPGTLRRRG